MQIDLIISYQNLDHSPVVEDLVRERIEALEKRYDRITGYEVTLYAPQKKEAPRSRSRSEAKSAFTRP